MLTPEEIAARQFLVSLRGYDRDEVAAFLREVATQQAELTEELRRLQRELEQAERGRDLAPATTTASAVEPAAPAAGAPLTAREAFAALGEETTRVLVAAEESAQAIREKAEERARTELENARREAREEVEGARRTASKIVADAERRRNAIAEDIRGLEHTRDAFVQGLRTAMKGVQGAVRGMQTASGTTQLAAEADADDEGERGTALAATPALAPATDAPAPLGAPERDDVEPEPASELEPVVEAEPAVESEPVVEPVVESEPVVGSRPEAAAEPERVADPEPEPAAEPEPEPEAGAAGQPEAGALAAGTDDEPVVDAEPAPPVSGEEAVEAAPATGLDPLVLRDQSLAGVRPGMLRRLKRALQDVQNGVLDALRQAGAQPDVEAVLPSDEDLAPVGAVAQMFLTASYRAGIADGAILLEREAPDDVADASRIPATSATFRAVFSHEITSALRATVRAGVEAGEPETSLSERVGEVFRDLKGPVVEQVVDQHLARVYGFGQLDVWRSFGVDGARWVLGQEPRCPANRCRMNDQEGGVPLGSEFPSGDVVPPAHDGCTCGLAPDTTGGLAPDTSSGLAPDTSSGLAPDGTGGSRE